MVSLICKPSAFTILQRGSFSTAGVPGAINPFHSLGGDLMQSYASQSARGRSTSPDTNMMRRVEQPTQSLQFLDLTGDPYGPMSGHNLSRGSHTQSNHTLCGHTDDCGPLARHPYCHMHCTNKHITYESKTNCFSVGDC